MKSWRKHVKHDYQVWKTNVWDITDAKAQMDLHESLHPHLDDDVVEQSASRRV
jgi:hypothetical protein